MSYKGDTPGKMLARLEVWRLIKEALGEKRFMEGKFLFLAGPTMGDAAVLLGMGVPAKKLLAVERDKVTAEVAARMFADVQVRHCDVLHELEGTPHAYDAIYLDFCAQLTENNLNTVALAALEGLKEDGVIACTFLAGREQDAPGGMRSQVLLMRHRVEQHLKKMSETEQSKWEEALPYIARLATLQKALLEKMRPHGLVPVPRGHVFYKSRSEGERKGMPMCIYIASTVANSRISVEDRLMAAMKETPETFFFDPSTKELGAYAMELEKLGYDPALLFNVSRASVSAWKAHAARGTYKK